MLKVETCWNLASDLKVQPGDAWFLHHRQMKPAVLASGWFQLEATMPTALFIGQIDLDALLMQHDATMCSMFSYFSDFFSVTLKRVMPVRQLSNRFPRAKSVATGCHGCLAHLVTVNIHIHPLTAAKLLENLGCKRTVLDRPLWIGHALWLSRQAGALKSVCTCQSQKSDQKKSCYVIQLQGISRSMTTKKQCFFCGSMGPLLTTTPYHRNCHTDPAIRLQDSTSSRSRAQQDLHEPHDFKIE